ncbi:hypothetical protein QTN25_009624 [Entamoeba marina]
MNTDNNKITYTILPEQPQNQNQPIYVAPTSSNENDGITAVILFVIGFLKSDDQLARILAILSLILTLITIGSIIISIVFSLVIVVFVCIIAFIEYGDEAFEDDIYI